MQSVYHVGTISAQGGCVQLLEGFWLCPAGSRFSVAFQVPFHLSFWGPEKAEVAGGPNTAVHMDYFLSHQMTLLIIYLYGGLRLSIIISSIKRSFTRNTWPSPRPLHPLIHSFLPPSSFHIFNSPIFLIPYFITHFSVLGCHCELSGVVSSSCTGWGIPRCWSAHWDIHYNLFTNQSEIIHITAWYLWITAWYLWITVPCWELAQTLSSLNPIVTTSE